MSISSINHFQNFLIHFANQVTARRRVIADKPPGSVCAAALPNMTDIGRFESSTPSVQSYGLVDAAARQPDATLGPRVGSSDPSSPIFHPLFPPKGAPSADSTLRTLALDSTSPPVMSLQGGTYSLHNSAPSLRAGVSIVIEAAAGEHVVSKLIFGLLDVSHCLPNDASAQVLMAPDGIVINGGSLTLRRVNIVTNHRCSSVHIFAV